MIIVGIIWSIALVRECKKPLNFAVVDEVDSILIDEARTPLIISGQSENNTDLYLKIDKIIPHLIRQKKEDADGDFWIDEKGSPSNSF